MSRLLILPAFLLTLLAVIPAFADDFEDSDETAKTEWSESVFARKYPYYCQKPTDDCFFHAEQNVSMSMLILTKIKKWRGLEATVECIRNVEGPKRGRAWMIYIKDNPHKSHRPLGETWKLAMKENFSHCW